MALIVNDGVKGLSSLATDTLKELENRIERGIMTFIEVGSALLEIRDRRLYREAGYPNFQAYCRERWGFSRPQAYRLIDAAEVTEILSPIGDSTPLPAHESQTRELVALRDNPEILRHVWARAFSESGGKPTAALIREAVHSETNMAVHYSSDRMDWETPQEFYSSLDSEFSFTLDVCATPDNAKCGNFFTPTDDGLRLPWNGICWMNPPYGDSIGLWVEKAYLESQRDVTVVCLIPSRTDTSWWHNYVMNASEIRFVRGRLKFVGAEAGAPFPSAVVVFRPGQSPPAVRGMGF